MMIPSIPIRITGQSPFIPQVNTSAFSDDGQIAVTGGFVVTGEELNDSTGEALTWDTFDGQLIGPVLEHPQVVTSVAISPNGRLVATGCRDSQVRWWLPRSGKSIVQANELSWAFDYGTVSGLAFSPDGRTLLAANLTTRACGQLFEVPTGSELAIPLRHKSDLTMAVFSHDGSSILTGSSDATARLWDANPAGRSDSQSIIPIPSFSSLSIRTESGWRRVTRAETYVSGTQPLLS